jgi:hypothetical protein
MLFGDTMFIDWLYVGKILTVDAIGNNSRMEFDLWTVIDELDYYDPYDPSVYNPDPPHGVCWWLLTRDIVERAMTYLYLHGVFGSTEYYILGNNKVWDSRIIDPPVGLPMQNTVNGLAYPPKLGWEEIFNLRFRGNAGGGTWDRMNVAYYIDYEQPMYVLTPEVTKMSCETSWTSRSVSKRPFAFKFGDTCVIDALYEEPKTLAFYGDRCEVSLSCYSVFDSLTLYNGISSEFSLGLTMFLDITGHFGFVSKMNEFDKNSHYFNFVVYDGFDSDILELKMKSFNIEIDRQACLVNEGNEEGVLIELECFQNRLQGKCHERG